MPSSNGEERKKPLYEEISRNLDNEEIGRLFQKQKDWDAHSIMVVGTGITPCLFGPWHIQCDITDHEYYYLSRLIGAINKHGYHPK